MNRLKKFCSDGAFSHIYIQEPSALISRRIIKSHPKAKIVLIDSYKNVFNRPRQVAKVQGLSPKIIIGKKQPPFLYSFPEYCQHGPYKEAVYITPAVGCLFTCEYCFLKGMYNTSNILVFSNQEEIFTALEQEAEKNVKDKPLWVSISYETDLLALESILGLCEDYIEFSRDKNNILLECRTKSAAFRRVAHLQPHKNFLWSFSLSPDSICSKYEKTPSLDSRLRAAKEAIALGWQVRLSLDPVIECEKFEEVYSAFLEKLWKELVPDNLFDVTVGPLRMSDSHKQKLSEVYPEAEHFFKTKIIDDLFYKTVVFPLENKLGKQRVITWEK